MSTTLSFRTCSIAAGAASALLIACSVASGKPEGPESLANRAPPAMSEAEIAVIHAAGHSPAEAEVSERGREIEEAREANADAQVNAQAKIVNEQVRSELQDITKLNLELRAETGASAKTQTTVDAGAANTGAGEVKTNTETKVNVQADGSVHLEL